MPNKIFIILLSKELVKKNESNIFFLLLKIPSLKFSRLLDKNIRLSVCPSVCMSASLSLQILKSNLVRQHFLYLDEQIGALCYRNGQKKNLEHFCLLTIFRVLKKYLLFEILQKCNYVDEKIAQIFFKKFHQL